MNIEIVLAYRHAQEINALFSEYTDMLIANDSSFQDYLAIQHYDEGSIIWKKNMVCHPADCIWLTVTEKPRAVSG